MRLVDDRHRVRLTVFSDYVCPFCYLELPVIDRLREEDGEALEVDWRAFELRPSPIPTLDPDSAYLHAVWDSSVYPMARERGVRLRLPPVQPRTRLAHEAAAFARDAGRFDAMHRAIFRAFFEDGRDIGDVEVLCELGASASLDVPALRAALERGTYTARVLEDERLAARLGVGAVPTILAGRPGAPLEQDALASGAVPYTALRRLVDLVRRGAAPARRVG